MRLISAWVRAQFPSLSQTVNGQPAIFLDGPGGTQVPQRVIEAISAYLRLTTPTPGVLTDQPEYGRNDCGGTGCDG